MKLTAFGVIVGLFVANLNVEAKDGPAEETLATIEHDFADMQITRDERAIKAIEAVMSDDFYFFDPTSGQRGSKAQLIASVRSARYVIKSMSFPSFLIRVFGSTAVAQGINDQTVTSNGKDFTATFAWLDVFEKRRGGWVWIVSESSQVNEKISDKILCDNSPCLMNRPGFELKAK